MYVSDPSGQMRISVKREEDLGRYRQGSETCELLFCKECAVLVAVVFEEEEKMIGGLNARCMDEYDEFGEPEVVSPRKLSKQEKIERWQKVWIRDVTINID